MVILGTEYAGEMKKGVFTVVNFLMPRAGLLPMHCSANAGAGGDTALFFGLSGTGKTTLSTNPQRRLIGDDEHVWSAEGIFNIEGGCYAKCIDLTPEQEPEIFRAIRFGTVLENVVCDEESRRVDYADSAITENTRAAYPIDYIPNAAIPCIGRHPRDIIFLTCDGLRCAATGQPPDARPSHVSLYERVHGQGRRHRDGRHRARGHVFGVLWRGLHGLASEQVRRPASRQDLHPQHPSLAGQYGWTGGRTAWVRASRFSTPRAIISAIHAGALADAPVEQDPHFGFDAICACPGVPSAQMVPRRTWADGTAYDERAGQLAELFKANFAAFEGEASPAVKRAGPT